MGPARIRITPVKGSPKKVQSIMLGLFIDGIIVWAVLVYFDRCSYADWPFGIAHALVIMVVNGIIGSVLSGPFLLLACIFIADGLYLMYMCTLTLKQAFIAVSVLLLWNLLFSLLLAGI